MSRLIQKDHELDIGIVVMAKASNIYIILGSIKTNEVQRQGRGSSKNFIIIVVQCTSKTPMSLMLRQNILSAKGYLSKGSLPYQKANPKTEHRNPSKLTTKSSNHRARRFHDSVSEQGPQFVPESSQSSEQNNKKCDATTDFPKVIFGLGGIDDAGKVHSVIRGEEGEWKEDDCYDGEDEDSFVLAVGNYRQFILFY